jgi:hypothetical protein
MSIIGVAVLCALALSAIAASGASAGTTAFTCVETEKGKGEFVNEHCSATSPGEKNWKHVPITESTGLTLNTIGTPPKLTGKLFGVEVELTSTGTKCVNCMAENKEVGGVMEVTGTGGQITFEKVKVVGMETKCVVVDAAEPAESEAVITKPLKFTTTSSSGATLEPETGTLFAEFEIKARTGQTCNVQGLVKVTGTAPATLSGSTLTVKIEKKSELLKANGEKASLTGEGTVLGGKTETPTEVKNHHPVALTPTTP